MPRTLFCESWNELARAVQQEDQPVVVFDPALLTDPAGSAVRLKQCYVSTTFVIYTALDPKPFGKIVELISAGFSDVVLFGFDDARSRLERLLEDLRGRAHLPGVTLAFQPRLQRLPASVRSAIENMMSEPRRYRTTRDLAAVAQMSTRAIFRHLKLAGFPSPRRLVASARVIHAYQLLSGGGRSVQDVALRLGYASADQLSQHFTELAGWTASDVKKGVPEKEFADAIVAGVLAPTVPIAAE